MKDHRFYLLSENREYYDVRVCENQDLPRPSNERVAKWLQDLSVPRNQSTTCSNCCPLNIRSSGLDNLRKQTPFPEDASAGSQVPAPQQMLEPCQRPPSSIASDFLPASTFPTGSKERMRISKKIGPNFGAKVGSVINWFGVKLPGNIRTHALQVIHKGRTDPKEMIHTVFSHMRELCMTVKNGELRSIRDIVLDPRFLDFYQGSDYSGPIATSCGASFDRRGLPGWCFPDIATPEPDYCIGYSWEAFNGVERKVMQIYGLEAHVMPTQMMFWPFLTFQFSANYSFEPQWMAENQNAATAIYAVNSMRTLFNHTSELPCDLMIDTVFFSCVAAEDQARLSVHWAEGSPRQLSFCSAVVHEYDFRMAKNWHKLRAAVHNIIDYGIGERLTLIKKALAEIRPDSRCWNDEQDD